MLLLNFLNSQFFHPKNLKFLKFCKFPPRYDQAILDMGAVIPCLTESVGHSTVLFFLLTTDPSEGADFSAVETHFYDQSQSLITHEIIDQR